MNSLAHTPAAFEVRMLEGNKAARVRLLPSGDGWALVARDGKVLFHALGTRGRRQCLEFARATGVLAVFS